MGRKRIASRRNFPPNLYINPSGYFYFINPINGKKKGVGSDRAEAFSQARQANAAIAALKPSSLVDWVNGTKSITLTEWVPQYLTLWIEKSNPAEATLRNHKIYLERIAASDFSWMPLKEITTAHVSSFLDAVVKNSGIGTAKSVRSRVQDVFRLAITKGFIDAGKNPVTATYKPIGDVLRERLSLEQFFLIRDKAPAWVANAMNLALVTGQRREDIVNMKFTDFVDGKLQIIQGKGQGKVRIKISGTLKLKVLGVSVEEAIQLCRDNVLSPYMVHHPKARSAGVIGRVTCNGLSTAFSNVRNAVGIVAADGRTPPTFHELRSLSERLYRVERNGEFTQKLLGHASPDMTSEYDKLRGTGWEEVG